MEGQAPGPATPGPLATPADNAAGRRTSERKLNGRYYTPADVAGRILDGARWPAGDAGVLLDPACGDGVFLEAALRKCAAADDARRIEGWDVDAAALAAARARLLAAARARGWGEAAGDAPRLVHRDALAAPAGRRDVTCVVGNPPYLEAKRMPAALKSRLRAGFPLSCRGAFDLYAPFVELALRQIGDRPGGELHLLLPNRVLCVSAASALRRALLASCRVEVDDLSGAAVFADAAVYPVVLRAFRSDGAPQPPATLASLLPVAPADPAGRRLLDRVLRGDLPRLSDLATVSWGVSFHRAGLRDRYVFAGRPPTDRARTFLGGGRFAGNREVTADGRVAWAGAWIDYDEARARADGNPLPPPAVFAAPKLALCQNARRARAGLDLDGHVLKDTFLSLRARPGPAEDAGGAERLLRWLQAVLHSDVFHYLYEHACAGTRKGGGYLHFLSGYLAPFPVPLPPDRDAWPGGDEPGAPGAAEALVRAGYGVTPDEAGALDAYPCPSP